MSYSTLCHTVVLLLIVLLTVKNNLIVVLGSQCKQANSYYRKRLRNHVFHETLESEVFECVLRCKDSVECQSMNYRMTDKLCQLNNATKASHIRDFGSDSDFIYMDNPDYYPKKIIRSCFDLKTLFPSKPSGYYDVMLKDRQIKVYCDMDNYDGGWTVVVAISNSNNNHLLSAEHNCLNASVCVPYDGDVVTAARKLPDSEIRQLGKGEGTFRVGRLGSSPCDVFYRIPSGPDKFDSSCIGRRCPRITVSYAPYPYVWESNPCKNISIGYLVQDRHNVFDGHDNAECESMWRSTSYDTKRVLYGYPHGGNQGLYNGIKGILFVR